MKTLLSRVRRLLRRHRRLVAALLAGVAVWAGLGVLRPADPPSAPVLVTLRAVTGGTSLQAGDVEVRHLPLVALPAEYLSDPAEAIGRLATVPLPAGAMLLPGSVVNRTALASPGKAVLPVTLTASAATLVRVGDRIDLLAADSDAEAAVVASAVRVVAVLDPGGDSSPLSPARSAGPVVLVELEPGLQARVAAVAARGTLGFSLR
ncbi:SAF domain-containing protein [Micropruina sonneratiae]|uniref:SAF domain-containing protein n=1 Tax=Micropruina sonneratiae TaxID=2986940 RepID=UPI0022260A5C|nr:SAF domain-containing protein [Micropruina sp. KQZ13P-5]MCW3158904.1 SAF domain-containing protein [Micropruina sp. KQZ13P-5]